MPTTSKWALPYPALTDNADVPEDIQALAVALDDVAKDSQGTFANRPVSTPGSPGKSGRYYTVRGDPDPTQNDRVYRDHGTGWIEVTSGTADGPAGTATRRTLGAGAQQAAAGNDARLSDQRTPLDNSVTAAKIVAALKPSGGAGAATEALRAIGSAAGQVVAGNDVRLTDQRVPIDASVTDAKIAASAAIKGSKLEPFALVSALPVSPYDGQVVLFQNTAMAAARVIWQFRWRAAVAIWEFIGGAPLVARTDGALTISDTSYTALAGGPSITVPLAGEYDCHFGSQIQGSNSINGAFMALSPNPVDVDSILASQGSSTDSGGSFARHVRKTGLVAATAVAAVARVNAGTGRYERRWLTILPVRVS